MRDTVRFLLAGRIEEIQNCDPTRTVLEFLREDKGLKGTKEGCAEGDCGACTVVVGELHNGGIRYRAVNSCIQLLATLDGKQLLTVEDLAQASDKGEYELHAVQRAMLEQHGSQCGFCTPGFVMSLFAMFHQDPEHAAERAGIDLGLAGNLCRCTGYAPIVRAAEQALTAGRSDRFTAQANIVVEKLRSIQDSTALALNDAGRWFYAPRSVAELCGLREAHPQAVLVAGATDLGLKVTKQNLRPGAVIYLGCIDELQQIVDDGEYLSIGATVTYTDATGAIAARYPAFLPLIRLIGGAQVRNAGTIGGNIANGSPIGDMPPGLIAAGAKLVLQSSTRQRCIDLEDYFISYGKQDLRAGEWVARILLPLPPANQLFSIYKISKRFEQDISAVCGAFAIELGDARVKSARICFGGMAETPKRATHCELALSGETWDAATINKAMHALTEDYTPLTDMRASAAYRMRVAQNLLQRFFLEHTGTTYPVRLTARYATGSPAGSAAGDVAGE
jgi:xanthine dehydrogenase small subunit